MTHLIFSIVMAREVCVAYQKSLRSFVDSVIDESGSDDVEWSVKGHVPTFKFVHAVAKRLAGGRTLERSEKRVCREVYESYFDAQIKGWGTSGKFCVLMAYSSDYAPGPLCEVRARKYCDLHGHDFICVVAPASEMRAKISPRTNLTWFKIPLLQMYLSEMYDYMDDADAAIVRQSIRVSSRAAYPDKDLIISEDLTPACLINSG